MLKKITKQQIKELIIEGKKFRKSVDNEFYNLSNDLEFKTGVAFYTYYDLILSFLRLDTPIIKIYEIFKILGFEVEWKDVKNVYFKSKSL